MALAHALNLAQYIMTFDLVDVHEVSNTIESKNVDWIQTFDVILWFKARK